MEKQNLVFIEKISLKPDRVTLFNEVLRLIPNTNELILNRKSAFKKSDLAENLKDKPILKREFHNFNISTSARKKIKEKITWLYHLSKSRYIKSYSGKEIFNFKLNFLTLTLPSSQIHSTSEITNVCFNQFLTELRSRTKMENYVWRLEFQKNGNVHYHIVTDTFVDYFFAQKIWNRIINKLGYVDRYTDKFKSMNLNEYLNAVDYNSFVDFDKLKKRYLKGVASGWKNPPSVDVKSCTSNKAISFYISKYFGKEKDNNTKKNVLDNEENSFQLRLWYCSRSLSKLTSVCLYREEALIDWYSYLKTALNVKSVVCDYAQCLFFDLSKLTNQLKSVLFPVFRNYANENGYSSA